MYIPAIKAKRQYKIFLEDVCRVHSFTRKSRPMIPAYDAESPTRKMEESTDFEFEPLVFSWNPSEET